MIGLLVVKLKDELRNSQFFREFFGKCFLLASRFVRDPRRRVSFLIRAIGLCEAERNWSRVIEAMDPESVEIDAWQDSLEHFSRLHEIVSSKPRFTRTVILKAPAEGGEKGVILMYFEYNLMRLLTLPKDDLDWISSRYEIVFAASWTPTCYPLLGLAANLLKDGFLLQPATNKERGRLRSFHQNIRVSDTLACNWIEASFYDPVPWANREFDILMVANWGEFKRHWDFFEALKKMPSDLRIVLVGQEEGGRTLSYIKNLAKKIGVPQKLEYRQSIPIEQVTSLQCNSKVCVVTSRREGGCVCMVEALFAGAAIAMRNDATIGPIAHVNEKTGLLLRPGKLAEDLMSILSQGSRLAPSEWARENISCENTLDSIEGELKAWSESRCIPWRKGLAPFHFRPYPILSREEDYELLSPVYEDLHSRFPGLFPSDLIVNSCK